MANKRYIEHMMKREFTSNYGDRFKILEITDDYLCTIVFEDGTISKNKSLTAIRKGAVKNRNSKCIFNTGYVGEGIYEAKSKVYMTWFNMIKRCYDIKTQIKFPTYKGIDVCEEWHNFQNFAKWHEENYNHKTMDGWQLDKDILLKGNKTYSPETCCFVPIELNNLLKNKNNKNTALSTGVFIKGNKYYAVIGMFGNSVNLGSFYTEKEARDIYLKNKKRYVKEIADKWKDKIEEKIYKALIYYYEDDINTKKHF